MRGESEDRRQEEGEREVGEEQEEDVKCKGRKFYLLTP